MKGSNAMPVWNMVSASPLRCEARVSVDPTHGTMPEVRCEGAAMHDGPHWYSARVTWNDPEPATQLPGQEQTISPAPSEEQPPPVDGSRCTLREDQDIEPARLLRDSGSHLDARSGAQ